MSVISPVDANVRTIPSGESISCVPFDLVSMRKYEPSREYDAAVTLPESVVGLLPGCSCVKETCRRLPSELK